MCGFHPSCLSVEACHAYSYLELLLIVPMPRLRSTEVQCLELVVLFAAALRLGMTPASLGSDSCTNIDLAGFMSSFCRVEVLQSAQAASAN